MKRKQVIAIVFFALGVCIFYLLTSGSDVQKPASIAKFDSLLPDYVDYNLHVKGILSEKCYACHGPDRNNGQKAGLDLSSSLSALKKLADGKHAIVPGKLSKSELYRRITTSDPGLMMPTKESGLHLTDFEKAILCRWIEQGAEFKEHWAFVAPAKTTVPSVKDKQWPKNVIDYFVLSKLEKSNLKPSPEADRETVLRRVSLDLTGLPPTPEETDAFLADESPGAYEKVVDRLLSSPHYGEKMATDWLDIARYADTHGYTIDLFRPVWQWRDWVIKSFNNNMPFDRFITLQLAGDLLPGAGREEKLATAFNRLHAQNMEGGIINEEFITEYVVDRVNTFGTAFLGMTVSCARCHDHKYDPISQKDFYSLYDFFDNIDEVGQISRDGAMPVPTLLLPDKRQDSLIAQLVSAEKVKQKELDALTQQCKSDFEIWKRDKAGKILFDRSRGLQASFTFDNFRDGYFISDVNKKDSGYVTSDINTVTIKDLDLAPGRSGKAFRSNGNDILRLGNTGIFSRIDAFSIGVWVKIPNDFNKGVILHSGNGDILYNFRGYYLNVRDGKAELLMAHSWPYNCIVKVSNRTLPKNQWVHLMLTYDGSGKAHGLKLFIDGVEQQMIIEKDNLYKDILFTHGYQPGLQVGADLRGFGFKNGLVDEVMIYERQLAPTEVSVLVESYSKKVLQALSETELWAFYLENVSTVVKKKNIELKQILATKNKIVEEVSEIMVMDELKNKKPARILNRGAYDDPAEQVQPGVPESILPYPTHLRKDRLGLAGWITHPKNPLTARVIVNRFWQAYFGTALHKNADNFGSQGGVPTHPDLLDRLAIEFIESGWNVKKFQKLIVMSSTYRQSSYHNRDLYVKDPANMLLARGPAFRLSAEMIRDAALKASGLLSKRIGGPSVKPYQPDGLWDVNGVESYQQDTGENLYRRGIYTFVKRTNPSPSMSAFDAPMRTSCVAVRQKTTTPMQALVLLNDPQFLEASKAVAANAMRRFAEPNERVKYCYRLLACRQPSAKETTVLEELYTNEVNRFRRRKGRMKGLLSAGEYKVTQVSQQEEWAALTVVANAVMNSDVFVTKR